MGDSNAADGRPTAALLFAGGIGSRLRPLTDTIPKCLIPIGGRMLLDFWIDNLLDAGVRRARINSHHLAAAVREKVRQVNDNSELVLTEKYEQTLLGSAGTIADNRDLADGADDVLLIYSDNLSGVSLGEFLAFHRSHSSPLSMLLFHAENPRACGIASLDNERTVIEFEEKPEHPKSDLANAGVYIVTGDAYREIADMQVFDIGFDVLPKFIGRMKGFVFEGYHRDIGTLKSLKQAEADVLGGKI